MALARGRAFLDTGNAEIIAVASRRRVHARAAATTLGAPDAFDDCFINPIRWIFGTVTEVTASANQLRHTGDGYVEQETCSATLRFQNGALYAAVAGYVTPPNYPRTAHVHVLGTRGALEMRLTTPATHTLYLAHGVTETVITEEPSSLQRQAQTFLDALEGNAQCRNPPSDAKIDVALAEAIVDAATRHQVRVE
jgi:predicted dehydrogenase